jgi:alpha-beta hydrolase superfamily lysophospholipase
MKPFLYFLAFQIFIHSVHGQTADSALKNSSQNALEQQLFPGAKLDKNFHVNFPGNVSELSVRAKDGTKLSGLLFKSDQTKGLIFYLHGSHGALDTWGKIASFYTALNYDVFMLDYRGYGKTDGKVTSEAQLYSDVQAAFDQMNLDYSQRSIVIIGQSLGTGPAAMLAANNKPRALILQAPYYSIADWIHNVAPGADTSNLKYQFRTYEYLPKTKAPVIIFHGDADDAVYYGSSEKLSSSFKLVDKLFILKGEGHNDFTKNAEYLEKLKDVLK